MLVVHKCFSLVVSCYSNSCAENARICLKSFNSSHGWTQHSCLTCSSNHTALNIRHEQTLRYVNQVTGVPCFPHQFNHFLATPPPWVNPSKLQLHEILASLHFFMQGHKRQPDGCWMTISVSLSQKTSLAFFFFFFFLFIIRWALLSSSGVLKPAPGDLTSGWD